ncbi:hypothetical protein CLU79DRAFT_773149 [Phycomyces nitens]|nr:hypothetical protein CLU79DRAFT_773149 [Phycomyces nitens]
MSSVSSYEGSDRDGIFHRSFPDGLQSRSYMRKTDLIDSLDASRSRDTDSWSVAATVDDQESVISGLGGTPSVVSFGPLTADGHTDDEQSLLERNSRDSLQLSIAIANSHPNIRNHDGSSLNDNRSTTEMDEDDKRSQSNHADFGDDGPHSVAEFNCSETSNNDDDDDQDHRLMSDDISAPPQPQPSFAASLPGKSYTDLIEENERLQVQMRRLEETKKHQAEVIENLRSLTGCDEELYGKALHLSYDLKVRPESEEYDNSGHHEGPPIINARTLAQRLSRLAHLLARFVKENVEKNWQTTFEQSLFTLIAESYLVALPFGTENQQLLNTAYSDQLRRFHSTLGSNFAKWYRRQTVQSLSLNMATKEYLDQMQNQTTERLSGMLHEVLKMSDQSKPITTGSLWADIMDLCTALSLDIHGGDADVSVQPIAVGVNYDSEIMVVVGDHHQDQTKVKCVLSPLFIDEDETVLLPARVLLE